MPISFVSLTCCHCGTPFQRDAAYVKRREAEGAVSHYCSKRCTGRTLASRHRAPTVLNEEQVIRLCAQVRRDPLQQYSDLARQYGVAYTTIKNTLLRHGVVLERRRGRFVVPGHRFWKLRYTATKAGHCFEVDIQYLHDLFHQQRSACAYTGWVLTFDSQGKRHNGTASLDRIDSTKGYVKGNVQWVHKHINAMKLWHTQEDFIALCKAVVRHCGSVESSPEEVERIKTLPSISTGKWHAKRTAAKST